MPAHLDYETFSECELKTAGMWAYARHPSTRILCLSWAVDDSQPRVWWPGGRMDKELLEVLRGEHGACRAFNACFEYAVTKYVGRKHGLPFVPLHKWEDTQAISRMCAFPASLNGVAKAVRLNIAKDKEGPRLINFFCKPQRDGSVNLPKDHPEEFRALCRYCMQDVRVDRAVHARMPVQKLPEFERQIWIEDAIVNERGVYVDRAMARSGVALREIARAQAVAQLPEMTRTKEFPNGAVQSLGQRKRILAYASHLKFPLTALDKETVSDALDCEDMPLPLRNLLELRASANLTSVAKYQAMGRSVCADSRIRGAHIYGKASTLRWGGTIVQFQNIPRPVHKLDDIDHQLFRDEDADTIMRLYPSLMLFLRDALRNTIRAAPGHVLHVVDKASIEARVLGWLANEPNYQKAFKTDLDLYKVTAAFIFNVLYGDVDDDQRWVGKQSVLGLQYSMGATAFWKWCKKNGRIMEMPLMELAVTKYRKLYTRIPAYWKEVETACKNAIRTGRSYPLGHGVVAEMQGRHLTIKLPSGRRLWYPDASLKFRPGKWGPQETICFWTEVNKQWVQATTYGGRLVENIVQAIARDLLACALLQCEARGYNPVMHVHDEIVCEVLKTLKGVFEGMTQIFRTPPPWGTGLILGSSGFTNHFYKKG